MSSLDKQEANNEHLTSARYWEELLGLREKERLFHDSEAQLAEREQKVAAREARLEADFSEMHALRAQLLTEKQRMRDGRRDGSDIGDGDDGSLHVGQDKDEQEEETPLENRILSSMPSTIGVDALTREYKLKASTLAEQLQRQQEEYQEEIRSLTKERDAAVSKLAMFQNTRMTQKRNSGKVSATEVCTLAMANPDIEEQSLDASVRVALKGASSKDLFEQGDGMDETTKNGAAPSARLVLYETKTTPSATSEALKEHSATHKSEAAIATASDKEKIRNVRTKIRNPGANSTMVTAPSESPMPGSAYLTGGYSKALLSMAASVRNNYHGEAQQPSSSAFGKKRDAKAAAKERRELALKKHADRLAKTRQRGGVAMVGSPRSSPRPF